MESLDARHIMPIAGLDFTITPRESREGPLVRTSVDELARVTTLDVQPRYGAALVDRDQAVALVALAGASLAELRAVGAAFDHARALAAARVDTRAPEETPAPLAHVAPVLTMRPAFTAPAAPADVRPEAYRPAVPKAPPPTSRDEMNAREKDAILAALDATNWNVVATARALNMARRTLYRRLKEYQIPYENRKTPVPEPLPEPVAEAAPAAEFSFRRKPGRPRKTA